MCLSLRVVTAALVLAVLGGCAAQRLRDEGDVLARAGNYEAALAKYNEGMTLYPDDGALRVGLLRTRSEAVSRMLASASALRAVPKLDEAEVLVDRALAIESGNDRARALKTQIERDRSAMAALSTANEQVVKRQFELARQTVEQGLRASPRQPELIALMRRIEAEQQRAIDGAGARLADARPISMQFRDANLKMVLEAFSRSTGVNFVVDRDIRQDQRITIFLRDSKLEDALDLLATTNQLGKKVLDPNTVLIYPNTAEKQKEYQDLVIRAFYLASADAKQVAALLRSMLKLKEVFVDERVNLVVIREPPETIRLAERLVALHDLTEPEVLMEVEVLEVKRSRLLELGIDFPDSFTLFPLSATGSATGLTVQDLRNLNSSRIGAVVPPVSVNLRQEIGDASVLANPRIRARNREKAKILIGDRVPVFTSIATSTGFVSENIQYIEVGLKLDVEPQVYVNDDIAIKVALEVSSIVREVRTQSGALAYQIGTRNATTTLRLRDGETQLLAGLISSEDRSSSRGLPFLSTLPIAGRLFSSTLDNRDRTEIVLSITPRLVSTPVRPDFAQTEFWSGTEATLRLTPSFGGVAAGERVGAPSSGVGTPPPLAPAAVAAAPPVVAPIAANLLRPASAGPALTGPATAAVGEAIEIRIGLESTIALRGLPMQVEFDRERLQLEDVQEGGFFKQEGGSVSLSHHVSPTDGRLLLGINRSGTEGVKGKDTVATLRFKTLRAGDASVAIVTANPITAGEAPPSYTLPATHIVRIR